MLMNRRKMLAYSLGTVALSLTGCTKKTTTVVVKNRTGAPLSVDAEASVDGKTYTFSKSNIPNKRQASQKFKTGGKGGTVTLDGTATVDGDDYPFTVPVKLGKNNVFTVSVNGDGDVLINGKPADA